MKAHFRNALYISTALIGVGISMPAAAQQSDSDIIVTARRTEERLQDVPISITVFNQQQLSNRNVTNAQDLATFTPSLQSNGNFGSDNSNFSLRGFVQDTGTQPSVGVYFADVVAPRGASNNLIVGDGAGPGNFFDLQNLQVLKGPQGTLFGRNTTGGAILIVPQKPTGKLEGYVEASGGNYNMRRIQGVLNVPVSDTFRVRAAVDHQTRDGYLINDSGVGNRDYNDIDYTAVRFSAVADLTPNLENYTIISYLHSSNQSSFQKIIAADPTDGLGGLAAGQIAAQKGDFWHGAANYPGSYSKLEQWQIINTTTWKATDNLTVKNVTSYAQLKDDLHSPLFGTNFSFGPGLPAYFAATNPTPFGHTANESTFTEELQLQGTTPSGKLTYQAGGYLEVASPLGVAGSLSENFVTCTSYTTLTCAGVSPFIPGGLNSTESKSAYHDVGAYAQATYKFTDHLKVTGGIRYTWDHATAEDQVLFYSGYPVGVQGTPTKYTCTNPNSANAAAVNAAAAAGSNIAALNNADCRINYYQHSSAPTWVVDLDYTPTEDQLLYAKYSRGYRAAVINPTLVAPFDFAGAEKVDTYEVGSKTTIRGAVPATLNIAAFYNNFSNQQTQLGFGAAEGASVSPAAGPVNLNKSRIWGVEVEGTITPFKGFQINGGYAHLDTKIRSIPDYGSINTFPYQLGGIPVVGDPLALTPRNKYTVTATYTLPVDDSVGKISLGATFTHTDSMLSNYNDKQYVGTAGSSPATVAYIQSLSWLQPTNLLNLNVGWIGVAGSSLDVNVFVTNVTNEKYYTYIPGLATTAGFEDANVGEPRMYGLRLKYRFGS